MRKDFIVALEQSSEKIITSEVNLNYISQNSNYQIASRLSKREELDNGRKIEVNSPIILNNSSAEKIVKTLLLQEDFIAKKIEFYLPYKYKYLEAGDNIKLQNENSFYNLKIISLSLKGAKIKVNANLFENNFYEDSLNDFEPSNSKIISEISDTRLEILDIPSLFNDADISKPIIRFAAAGEGENWSGAAIYLSNISENTGFEKIAEISSASTMGFLVNEISSTSNFVMDKVTNPEIILQSGSLESVSDANLQSFKNLALLGDEVVQFQQSTIIEENKYQINNLYRGKFGTENFQNHSAGERFILLDNNILKIEVPQNYIGGKFWIKAVSFGKSVEEAESIEFNFAGNSLKPYSPVYINAKKQGDDIKISWIRRARSNNNFSSMVEIPIFENSEKYEVEILDGADVKRVLNSNITEINYTSAQQISDFGSLQSDIEINIFQISDKVGRGFEASKTISF